MNIIIIEDELPQATYMSLLLKIELNKLKATDKTLSNFNFHIYTAITANEAAFEIFQRHYDIAIIDLNLNNNSLDGFTMINYLKDSSPYCKIIVRSAMTSFENTNHLLELASKNQQNILSFVEKNKYGEEKIITLTKEIIFGTYGPLKKYKDLKHHIGSITVTIGEITVSLTPVQGLILDKFMINENILLTYQTIYDCIPHRETQYPDVKGQIQDHVSKLRKALSNNPDAYIHTKWGIGYWLGDSGKF